MEKLWKKQAITIPTSRSTYRAMIGNYQRQACWDSAGYVYIVTAEDNGSGNMKRLAVYRSVNGNFDLSAGFTFQADTTIANGYIANEILSLTEFSAQLRNNRIYIAFTFANPPAIVSGVELISYDINAFKFERIDYRASMTGSPPTPKINSVDLSLSPHRAHGDIIVSWFEYDRIMSPTAWRRRYLREIITKSIPMGTGGAGYSDESLPAVNILYPCFLSNFHGDDAAWSIVKGQSASSATLFDLAYFYRELLKGSSTGPIELALGATKAEPFGHFKAVYNEKYNMEVFTHWEVLNSNTGWRLNFGVRGPEGIYETFIIAEFDYTNLGVSDVFINIPNVHPEAIVMVDDQGGTYVIASFPSPSSRPLSGSPGIGRIDNPYYNMAMAYWATDDFDNLDGINYETVWNGLTTGTQMRYLSAPDIFPAGDSLTIRATKLFFTCVDTHNDSDGQVIIYRE